MNYILNLLFGKKKVKKTSLMKEFLSDPDAFEYNVKVVDGKEIVITIKRQELE